MNCLEKPPEKCCDRFGTAALRKASQSDGRKVGRESDSRNSCSVLELRQRATKLAFPIIVYDLVLLSQYGQIKQQ
jgi:hypothetical protein